MSDLVAGLVAQVRSGGDASLLELTEKYDGVALEALEVPRQALRDAYDRVGTETVETLEFAAEQLRAFARKQLDCFAPLRYESLPGITLGHRLVPVKSVGRVRARRPLSPAVDGAALGHSRQGRGRGPCRSLLAALQGFRRGPPRRPRRPRHRRRRPGVLHGRRAGHRRLRVRDGVGAEGRHDRRPRQQVRHRSQAADLGSRRDRPAGRDPARSSSSPTTRRTRGGSPSTSSPNASTTPTPSRGS